MYVLRKNSVRMDIKKMGAAALFVLAILLPAGLAAQVQLRSLNSDADGVLWKVKAKADVGTDFSAVLENGYNMSDWVEAIVPGTVYSSYVALGLEDTPEYSDNIYQSSRDDFERDYWYRTEFDFSPEQGFSRVWLNFDGVNRDADIYLNGTLLGSIHGHVYRGKYDITDIVKTDQANTLALLVYVPVPPMNCSASPTYIASASWDWMPYVPDLNMGITDEVFITYSGDVTIRDPWIRTSVPDLQHGELDISLELNNHSEQALDATITGIIQPGNVQFSKTVTIEAGGKDSTVFNKDSFAQLVIENPELWWPNGYGEQNLYTCSFVCTVDGEVSDSTQVRFGIREYSYDTEDEVLHVLVNGKRVYLKGGNWGMSEYLLRCRGDEYKTKLRLHKEMNFNMIRNWTGAVTDDEFYEQCDENGIMLWDDFWLISTFIYWPRSQEIFNDNVIEKIKRRRNYACIAVWCGMNEWDPPQDYLDLFNAALTTYDGNDRYFQPNSNKVNISGSGPWTNFTPEEYFSSAVGGRGNYGLRSEIGTAVFTTFDSFREFMPKEYWWPRNNMWNIHYFGDMAYNAIPDKFFNSVKDRYGESDSIQEFCRKAQLLNIETNKGMFEGWQHHLWNDASGILIWMSQSAYPSLVWQTYDYYYDLTGAFWGARKACEPIHIQWSAADNTVEVVNTSGTDYSGLTARAEVLNTDGSIAAELSDEAVVASLSNTVTPCFKINFNPDNLAIGKPIYASSVGDGLEAVNANDGNKSSRWSSSYANDQWIYIDLEEQMEFSQVVLYWEAAYGKEYKIQVSNDANEWTDVYYTNSSDGGTDLINFEPVSARYVRMYGISRGTGWGFSLFEFEISAASATTPDLSAVHFIRLFLNDAEGTLLSDNFYWRGLSSSNFSALNKLPKVELDITTTETRRNDTVFVSAQIVNPDTVVAFANYVKLVSVSTGKRILPVLMDDGYFSLFPGETKHLELSFREEILGDDAYDLVVQPYNSYYEIIESVPVPEEKNEILLYPNPVNEQLMIQGCDAGSKKMVYNIQGQQVAYTTDDVLDTSELLPGIYLILIETQKGPVMRKFVRN